MRKQTAVAVIAAATSAGALALAMGPLDPPPGPVTETGTTTDELNAKLDQLILAQSGTIDTSGPYESFTAPDFGDFMTELDGELIVQGRVYVHSVSITFGTAALFDGPGALSSSERITSGDWIARPVHSFSVSGSNLGVQYTTVTQPVEQIVENGLYAAWIPRDSSGSITILYKRLPDLAAPQGANE